MKKVLITLSVILTVCAAFAALVNAPIADKSLDAVYEWALDRTVCADGMLDSVNSTSDSATLVNKGTFDGGWEYILQTAALGGTNSGTAELIVKIDALDSAYQVIERAMVDTLDQSGLATRMFLPIGNKLFGNYYTIKAHAGGANGSVVVIKNAYIYKRRPIQIQKRW